MLVNGGLVSAINFNHNFTDIICPVNIANLHQRTGPGIIDICKFCDKCNVIFVFVYKHNNVDVMIYDLFDIDCYFYLDGKEIFKYFTNLNHLDYSCEELLIKLLLE